MKTNKFQKRLRVKECGMLRGTHLQSVHQKLAQRTAKPIVCGNVEADFFAREDGEWQLVAHELAQNEFLLRASNLESGRQGRSKFHDAGIEKRRKHLQGMAHAHAVAFGKNIVSKIIFLTQPQESRQRILIWR